MQPFKIDHSACVCSDNTVSSRRSGDWEEAVSALHYGEICFWRHVKPRRKSVANVDLTSPKHPAWSCWVLARSVTLCWTSVGERGLSACLVLLTVA